MSKQTGSLVVSVLSVTLCFFTLITVNYNLLQPQSALAIFVMLGMMLCFWTCPAARWIRPPDDPPVDANCPLWKRARVFWLADRIVGVVLALLTAVCFGYLFVQTEPWPWFKEHLWYGGQSLGNRAGQEATLDFVIGGIGLALVLEATRRSIGWVVPVLSLAFMLHAWCAADLPDWLLPHQGLSVQQIVGSTFLQSLGVLGPAASVMFTYVFLFVLFGAFLEMSGATQFIIDFSGRIFGATPGGPAKVSVLSSGLMGSLSGSAVANAVTTGAFTIPMMRSAGFQPHVAAGIEAAASSGGALVPPVMGAGAYMMLEFIERAPGQPQLTFLEIAKAALIPAILYYFSLLMIVHFYSKRIGARPVDTTGQKGQRIWEFEALVFFGSLSTLVGLLLLGFSAFKAVTGSLVVILVLAAVRPRLGLDMGARVFALVSFALVVVLHQATGVFAQSTAVLGSWFQPFVATAWRHPVEGYVSARLVFDSLLGSAIMGMIGLLIFALLHRSWRPAMLLAMTNSARNGISLVAASACVGIIIGIVQTTPIANDFGEAIKQVVESSLLLALIGIMVCSLVLGMGVPSVVCYLLMATLMGSLLGDMGVDPLAAHLFIFYFGMMSMVTPPVSLAAYATASIAGAKIMAASNAAFRFALVGFTLPYMFIYRPSLLLMGEGGQPFSRADVPELAMALLVAVLGIVSLAAGLTGYLKTNLSIPMRGLAFLAALLMLVPRLEIAGRNFGGIVDGTGIALFVVILVLNWRRASGSASRS
ncbi:MAG: TRAP transporter fused permease subunit [Pirellulaceae bacterium]|nr:TRAP transporter fused permease subunit [Pirellulaceae bacterium]